MAEKEVAKMMNWNDSSWDWANWTMLVMMVVFVGLVAWAVVALVRNGSRSTPQPTTAEEVLAQRFARGEIDDDEYLHRHAVLDTKGEPARGRARPKPLVR
jgi:putative membrane protein